MRMLRENERNVRVRAPLGAAHSRHPKIGIKQVKQKKQTTKAAAQASLER